MKKILVALDKSPLAERIIINAENLKNSIGGELAIISVTDLIIDLSDSGNTPLKLIMADKNGRKEFILNLLEINNIKCDKLFFENGKPKQIILDIAKKWEADIIVIGIHGKEEIENVLMGSVAENIIRNSEIPVLVITSKHK